MVDERKLAHTASSSSEDLRTNSANHIQSYISTHYNVRELLQQALWRYGSREAGPRIQTSMWQQRDHGHSVVHAAFRQAAESLLGCVQVGNDVVLRLEFIRDRQMKLALIGMWVVEFLAFIALVVCISLKLSKVRAAQGGAQHCYAGRAAASVRRVHLELCRGRMCCPCIESLVTKVQLKIPHLCSQSYVQSIVTYGPLQQAQVR